MSMFTSDVHGSRGAGFTTCGKTRILVILFMENVLGSP